MYILIEGNRILVYKNTAHDLRGEIMPMPRLVIFIGIAFVIIGVALFMRFLVQPRALAKNHPVVFPSRKYTAEYESIQTGDPRSPFHHRISCNGTGLLIHDWNKIRYLSDADKKLLYIISPSEKIINIHRSNLEQTGGEWLDEEMFLQSLSESARYKKLGEEKMNGHNCRVYVNAEAGKRWYDTDAKVLVFDRFAHGAGKTKLLKYSSHALPSKEFELPKGYEIRDATK